MDKCSNLKTFIDKKTAEIDTNMSTRAGDPNFHIYYGCKIYRDRMNQSNHNTREVDSRVSLIVLCLHDRFHWKIVQYVNISNRA